MPGPWPAVGDPDVEVESTASSTATGSVRAGMVMVTRRRCWHTGRRSRAAAVRLADFDYDLPPERIAQDPIEPRDAARLLVDRGERRRPSTATCATSPSCCGQATSSCVNDTRVIPARLRLRRATGGAVEVLLLEPLDDERRAWEALVRPARRLRPGEVLFDAGGVPVVDGRRADRRRRHRSRVHARRRRATPLDVLARHGEVPLPPYITAPLADPERYQTVYAAEPGSAAAPTAGLHLTPELLDALAGVGVTVARVELVVGLDTFQPVSATTTRATTRSTASATGSRRRRSHACRDAAARGRRRHDRGAGPRERGRDRRAGRPDPACSSTARTTGRSSTCC